MREMKSLTLNDKTYDSFVDGVARPLAEASAIITSASGENIVAMDSSEHGYVGLHIYGKSTQTGTPTPDAPVDIVSIGEDGSINTTINGINLFNLESAHRSGSTDGAEFIDNGFVLNADTTATRIYRFQCNLKKGLTYFISLDSQVVSGSGVVQAYLPKIMQYFEIGKKFIPNEDTDEIGLYVAEKSVPTVLNITNVQVSMTSTKQAYEPFKTQAISVVSANGLRGIPVTDKRLATHIDSNGQMWCADEIDLGRGVRIQRVGEITLTESNDWMSCGAAVSCFGIANFSKYVGGLNNLMCDKLAYKGNAQSQTGLGYAISGNAYDIYKHFLYVQVPTSVVPIGDVASFKAWVANNHLTVIYVLATPVETPLTDDEIASIEALHTDKPSTTVTNDSGAYMSLEYVADAKAYIDSRFASAILPATVE